MYIRPMDALTSLVYYRPEQHQDEMYLNKEIDFGLFKLLHFKVSVLYFVRLTGV